MSHVPHKLAEEFPDHTAEISRLRSTDAHFARLASAYEALNLQIHRAETLIEPLDDLAETELHKRRAVLKDEIYRQIVTADQQRIYG